MLSERRSVSLTSTGPDDVVIEVQLSGPDDIPPDTLRARLDVAVRHVVEIFVTGQPIDVEIGSAWLSGRALT